jgi:hypothetical protein
MYLPHLKYAHPVRRYSIGDYAATLLSDCETTSDVIDYAHVLVVYQIITSTATATPALVIASETNTNLQKDGFYFLCTFASEHRNYGASQDWGDLEKFEKAALQLAGQVLEVQDPPTLIKDHRANR